jgi:hypothetical protein
MEYWEFLIQREGDRTWRSIKTGNLQLKEGKYRIVANSNLLQTQIQTRVTHQTLASTAPQRRSRSYKQTTNPRGLLVIIPFTHLHSGIWQFVCSGNTSAQTPSHQILKLRVLPRTQISAPVPSIKPHQSETLDIDTVTDRVTLDRSPGVKTSEDLATPTEPITSISMVGEQENWADGLDRLLAQLERESLQPQPQQPAIREIIPGTIQLSEIVDLPSQLISLDRSTFSGLIPGHRLTIGGACNVKLLNAHLVSTAKVEKLSICLRHPQTSEIIVSIEQSLPPDLHTFIFRGRVELPTELKISLLLGEVNLYDRHHIQLGSSGFTVTLNLNPLHESELSLLQALDVSTDSTAANIDLLTRELQLETDAIVSRASLEQPPLWRNKFTPISTIKPLNSPQDPTVSLAYKRESLFTHPDVVPVNPSTIRHPLDRRPSHSIDITGDLEIDFAHATSDSISDRPPYAPRNYQNLEIVIDD